ncbi:hypothetical protein DENSPDRAFT_838885 [Dentipellis sp. KUC8613]|nr:hypothetical protein DENSPDRAFT_838885 [Dentipellis sp. KUC8613]
MSKLQDKLNPMCVPYWKAGAFYQRSTTLVWIQGNEHLLYRALESHYSTERSKPPHLSFWEPISLSDSPVHLIPKTVLRLPEPLNDSRNIPGVGVSYLLLHERAETIFRAYHEIYLPFTAKPGVEGGVQDKEYHLGETVQILGRDGWYHFYKLKTNYRGCLITAPYSKNLLKRINALSNARWIDLVKLELCVKGAVGGNG